MKTNKHKVLRKLFFSTLYLSAFTFGGGYVIVTLLKKKFVDELHWIDEEEMLDLVAIAQSSPGAIAVNGAIVVGYKLAGLLGVLVSVLGAILPPFFILTTLSFFYGMFRENHIIQSMLKGMNAGVAAVIISVVWDMAAGIIASRDLLLIVIMLLAFVANYIFGINVVLIILATALFGGLYTLLREKKSKGDMKEDLHR
jgi:chromate transporter